MAPRTPWFPARRYGWGWGLPRTWQGWLVYAAWLLLAVAGAPAFPPPRHLLAFLAWEGGLLVLLAAVCYALGERPRWRWGGGRN